MKMTDKLLPCPFCGAEASVDTVIPDTTDLGYSVTCIGTEPCSGDIDRPNCLWKTPQEAVEAWNKRAQSPIIFDPTDPRVVVGREYEFSDLYNFAVFHKGRLEMAETVTKYPFLLGEYGLRYAFIREVKK